MRKLIFLFTIPFVLLVTSLAPAIERCKSMKNLNNSTSLAKEVLRTFLFQAVPDTKFRVVSGKTSGEYLIIDRPIDSLPRSLRSAGRHYWGVELGGERSVSIVTIQGAQVVSVADLSFVIRLRRNIEDQDELKKVFIEIRNFGSGVTAPGWYVNRFWTVRFATFRGFLNSSRLISALPEEFVEFSTLNSVTAL
jgi:hypothetical protein